MKRIKTRLKTTMVEERLSDLSILSIEKEVAQSIEEDKSLMSLLVVIKIGEFF
uniref:Uncharacterized protein n=1 Tax=Amphimedon queenslandica TaxID=400682 RepID=A0A1X7U027_AMPQE